MKTLFLAASVSVLALGSAQAIDGNSISYSGLAADRTVDTDGNVDMNGAAITLNGRVGGNVDMNGAAVDLNAEIGGDLYANGGAISIDAEVGGETEVNGGAITLEGSYNGDAHINGGALDLNGNFQRISANFGDLDFRGTAAGPVELSGQRRGGLFRRGDQSEVYISGHLAAGGEICAHSVEFDDGARVDGTLMVYADEEPSYPAGFNAASITFVERTEQDCPSI